MPGTDRLPARDRADLLDRLKRIEGQARGIRAMIERDRECADVINQMVAIRAAVAALNGAMVESYALHCLRHPEDFASPEAAVHQAVTSLVRAGQ
jgi:DNA-binding FrmR family transcriptional regulator